MKALRIKSPGGLENLVYEDISDPGKPKAGEIRVAIKAGSLNFHDLMIALGQIPTEENRIPLSDGAGIVEEVGDGVSDFKVGDRVVSTFFPLWNAGRPVPEVRNFKNTPGDGINGFACEYAVRSAAAFTLAPRNYKHEESATITTSGLTAWRALVVDGQLKAGDVVLVQGTGGVSITALQIAKAMGATVIATSSSDEKIEALKSLGADYTINYKTVPEWGKEALKLSDYHGADHVIEVGGQDTLAQSIKALRVGGHIAQIGLLSGADAHYSVVGLLSKHARIQSLIVGNRQHQRDFVRAIEQTKIKPKIDKIFHYSELAEAFAYQQSGKHFGKICVRW